MTRSRRPSAQTTAVVLALAEEPTAWRYGYQLCQQLDIKPGSLYPILMRLTDRGLLEATWDTDVPAGRPPRHLYRLTGSGRAAGRPSSPLTPPPHRPRPAAARAEAKGGRAHDRRRRLQDRRPGRRLAWVVFYAVALATADHRPTPVTAVAQLVVPPLLGVALLQIGSAAVAARSCAPGPGSGPVRPRLDPPGRLLAAAVAALPERRREWGRAMLAELAEVRGPVGPLAVRAQQRPGHAVAAAGGRLADARARRPGRSWPRSRPSGPRSARRCPG